MKTTIIGLRLLLLLGYLLGSAGWSAKMAFDVVTMTNGDIHNGTLAQERFDLKTPYGLVSIPYSQMASLQRNSTDQVQITTLSGDQFTGILSSEAFTILRVLDPSLPLDSKDIGEVIFGNRKFKLPAIYSPDLIIAQNGDTFAGRILTADFLVMGDNGMRMLGIDSITYLQLTAPFEGERMQVQITTKKGRIVRGAMMLSKVRVRAGHGAVLDIAVDQMSAFAMQVNASGQRNDYLFRQRFDPHDLIQDAMVDGRKGPRLLVLSGGQSQRGDIQGGGDGDEQPSQTVTLKPFAIGLHEVTFAEYDLYCEATGKNKPDDQEWGRGHRPVVNISWEEAVAYTEWLSKRLGKHYRLPTDSEWEYAARGGQQTRFWWGNEIGVAQANCEGCGSLWDGEKTAPVGRFEPNGFGLHDTAGNVFEWVADCWHDKFSEAPADGSALDKPGCGKRVIRGGAWSFPPHEVRSANRWRDFPSRRSDDTGFRLVRELE